jgi:hypothetical protein
VGEHDDYFKRRMQEHVWQPIRDQLNIMHLRRWTQVYLQSTCKTDFEERIVFNSSFKGDSGGGLVVDDNGTKKVQGVVSFGTKSCQSSNPQCYAKVAYYLQWINDKTGIPIKSS